MNLSTYIKPACIASDIYKNKKTLLRSYASLKPRLIELRGDTVGISLVYDKKLYVGFRGCKSINEVLYCVETGMTKPFIKKQVKINKAMWDKYEEIQEDINSVLKEDKKGVDEVIFTGHSLGGAIAQISALVNKGNCVTFGAPHVGDAEYKKECDAVIHDNVRVVVNQDIIPKIKFNDELCHSGKDVKLNSLSKSIFPYCINDNHASTNYLQCLRQHYDDDCFS